jgi:hypothetical protein
LGSMAGRRGVAARRRRRRRSGSAYERDARPAAALRMPQMAAVRLLPPGNFPDRNTGRRLSLFAALATGCLAGGVAPANSLHSYITRRRDTWRVRQPGGNVKERHRRARLACAGRAQLRSSKGPKSQSAGRRQPEETAGFEGTTG